MIERAWEGDRTAEVVKSDTGAIVRTQTRTFDELGRMLQDIGAAAQTTTYGYDPDGNTTAVTDALAQTTAQAFDGLNRLVGYRCQESEVRGQTSGLAAARAPSVPCLPQPRQPRRQSDIWLLTSDL